MLGMARLAPRMIRRRRWICGARRNGSKACLDSEERDMLRRFRRFANRPAGPTGDPWPAKAMQQGPALIVRSKSPFRNCRCRSQPEEFRLSILSPLHPHGADMRRTFQIGRFAPDPDSCLGASRSPRQGGAPLYPSGSYVAWSRVDRFGVTISFSSATGITSSRGLNPLGARSSTSCRNAADGFLCHWGRQARWQRPHGVPEASLVAQ
jgi:hypothetical protein